MIADPIAHFLQSTPSPQSVSSSGRPSKRLFLPVLTNAHSRLSLSQMNKGFITYEELLQGLHFSLSGGLGNEMIASPELTVYAGVVYETCFQPAMLGKGPGFVLARDLIGNETAFLRAVVQVLLTHTNGKECSVIEELKADIATFLKKSGGGSPPSSFFDPPLGSSFAPPAVPLAPSSNASSAAIGQNPRFQPSNSTNYPPSAPSSALGSMDFGRSSLTGRENSFNSNQFNTGGNNNPANNAYHFQQQQQNLTTLNHGYHSFGANPTPSQWNKASMTGQRSNNSNTIANNYPPHRLHQSHGEAFQMNHRDNGNNNGGVGALNLPRDIEKSEPIIRLLAHLRKSGMDILFPQIIHDKILMCIYVAMTCTSSLTHRELIDMVMSIKDSHVLTQIDTISKTKIRGVLALLKHGQLFLTRGEEGEAVQLYLAEDIRSFKDLREKHDAFLSTWILQHHLYIPAILKGELLWQLDHETKMLRLEELKTLEQTIEHYYLNVYQPTFGQSEVSSGSGAGGGVLASSIIQGNNRQMPLSAQFMANANNAANNSWNDVNASGNMNYGNNGATASRIIGGGNNTVNAEGMNYSSLFYSSSNVNNASKYQFDAPAPPASSAHAVAAGLFNVGHEEKSIESAKDAFLRTSSSSLTTSDRDRESFSYWTSNNNGGSNALLAEGVNGAGNVGRFSEQSFFSTTDIESIIDQQPSQEPPSQSSRGGAAPSPPSTSPSAFKKEFNRSASDASESKLC